MYTTTTTITAAAAATEHCYYSTSCLVLQLVNMIGALVPIFDLHLEETFDNILF